VKGQFTATGTFETGRGHPVLIAVLLGLAALVSWLLTVLVDLAITAGGLAAAVIAVCLLVRRRSDHDAELLAERAAALYAEATAPRAVPREVHYHVHLGPGATADDIRQALPPGAAITTSQEGPAKP
jgi:hypothetical protein